jgi:hypothetical protein
MTTLLSSSSSHDFPRRRFRFRILSRCLIRFMLLAVSLSFCAAAGAQAQQTPRVTPFTLKTETILYQQEPRGKVITRTTTARRADGVAAAIVTGLPQNDVKRSITERFISYSDGRAAEVIDLIRGVVEWPPPKNRDVHNRQDGKRANGTDCQGSAGPGKYLAGYETLGEVRADVLKSVPKGSAGTTLWLAPELACQELASKMTEVQMDGSFRMVSEEKFLGIQFGEPDPRMFEVPTDYQKLIPSQARRMEYKKLGTPWTKEARQLAAREDDMYYGRLPAKQIGPTKR